ncbi:MAG: AAA family ATPase [Nostoc sp.]
MDGKRFIYSIQLENFLSYGNEGEKIELQPLNVLIGANSSGKSNLIEAIEILRATRTDLPAPFRQGGGITEFLWKSGQENPVAKIKAIVNYPEGLQPLHYQLMFTSNSRGRLDLIDEIIENQYLNSVDNALISYYRYYSGYPELMVQKINYLQQNGNYIYPKI